jgi:hypothetical protein
MEKVHGSRWQTSSCTIALAMGILLILRYRTIIIAAL